MKNMRRFILTIALLASSPSASPSYSVIHDGEFNVRVLRSIDKPLTAFSPTFIDPKVVSENKISKKDSGYINSKNSKELTCLANNIYFEASGESRKGKIAVANVTMKRLKQFRHKKGNKPSTVCGVVYAHNKKTCAFSWTCDKLSNSPPYENQSYSDSKEIAWLALNGNLQDVTGGADFYHAKYVRPKWANKMKITAVIGGHIFYNSTIKKA